MVAMSAPRANALTKRANSRETDAGNASETRRSASSDVDERLDFYSDHFDPLLALNSPGCTPPMRDAKLFDNLAMFDAHLKRGASGSSGAGKSNKSRCIDKQLAESVRRFESHQMPIVTKRKQMKTIRDRMEGYNKGVLGALAKARADGVRVIVTTRHTHGVRGVCIAHVTLFDKFWNLTLRNVHEVWMRKTNARVPAIGDATTGGEKRRSYEKLFANECDHHCTDDDVVVQGEIAKLRRMLAKGAKNSQLCQRHVSEMLIRGEQIVHIAITAAH